MSPDGGDDAAPPPRGRPPGTGGDDAGRPPPGDRRGTPRKPFLLRLPPELMEELRAWANQELRSLNGHIEWVLRDAVRRRRGPGGGPAA